MDAKLYSTPSCVYCRKAKDYFDRMGVKYTEYDVSRNQKYAEDMVRKSGQMGVPVIILKNQVIIGFNKPKIDQLLNVN